LMIGKKEVKCGDGAHYLEVGCKILAKQVADMILSDWIIKGLNQMKMTRRLWQQLP